MPITKEVRFCTVSVGLSTTVPAAPSTYSDVCDSCCVLRRGISSPDLFPSCPLHPRRRRPVLPPGVLAAPCWFLYRLHGFHCIINFPQARRRGRRLVTGEV